MSQVSYNIPQPINEEVFSVAFGTDSETFFREKLTRSDLIEIINHPDIQIRYSDDRREHNSYIAEVDKHCLIDDILGEGFDTQTLINVIREVLGEK